MIETTTYRLPASSPLANHGKTLAGWVLFWGVTVGLTVLAVGIFTNPGILIAGIVITIASLVGSFVLRAMGKGQPKSTSARSDWYA